MVEEVDAFLSDPNHLKTDDGLDLDHPTDKPHLYALPAMRQRLRPVLSLLPSAIFECLVIDRKLVILASASPREPWNGLHDDLDPIAHGSYSCRGRYLHDPVMFRLEFSPQRNRSSSTKHRQDHHVGSLYARECDSESHDPRVQPLDESICKPHFQSRRREFPRVISRRECRKNHDHQVPRLPQLESLVQLGPTSVM